MKKLLILAMLVSVGFVWAQTEDYYVTYNDEYATDTTADEIVFSEPIAVSSISDIISGSQTEELPEQNMTVSAEATLSKYTKKINIPLWYRWNEYSFNVLIPYFAEKQLSSLGDSKISGFGDITIGAGYGKYLDRYKTYIDLNLSAKLPTGQEDVEDEYGNKYNLTTETTDISLAASGFYFMDDFTFKSTILYKYNGTKTLENIVWNSTTAEWEDGESDTGDLFMFSAGADYRWDYNLTFGLNMLLGMRMADEIEGVSNKDALTFIDLAPSVKYPISLFEFVLGAKIPVMTSSEAHDPDNAMSNQENRSSTFFFRTNYRIF